MTTHIPRPRTLPVLGNLPQIDGERPVQSMIALAREHGPIFQLTLPGRTVTIVSSQELVHDACDQERFDKLIHAPLREVRAFAGDGLFTAATQEPNWHKAHNILLPNFSMRAMQGYMPAMLDIAEQLVLKWERLNPDETIDVADDMTRLTLDTIGLAGFDYRFNSFYRETPHPFIRAMVRSLDEAMHRVRRLPIHEALLFTSHQQFAGDVAEMNQLVDTIIRERKAHPDPSKRDLLSYMLEGVDRQSGAGLDDLNIRYQIITFLIAGHETTSGLLSFAISFLLKHPEVLRRAHAEVDRVLGPDPSARPSYAQVMQLNYVQQILKESLRLWPTAPVFSVYPYEDTLLAGRYPIAKGAPVNVLIPMLHRDPTVWENPEAFDPDRFAHDAEQALPPDAYKPFGNGQRACIGRQFALQEATLVLAMILQRFELIDHADYQLRVKETLTLKPEGLTIRVRPRLRREAGSRPAPAIAASAAPAASPPVGEPADHHTPLLVLYGSNMGTAESVARELLDAGAARGYAASMAPLDEHVGRLPQDGAVVLVSSSYNGAPPDNAAGFVGWLADPGLAADALRGVRYAVFGCGDHNWASTYQAVPTRIDAGLAAHGAERLLERGAADAADDFDGQLRAWEATLWPALAAAFGLGESAAPAIAGPAYRFEEVSHPAATHAAAGYGARPMRVRASRELQAAEAGRSTRHIELELPEGVLYRAGDHLGVLPQNSPALVRRALARLGRDGDQQVIIRRDAPGGSHLPLDRPVSLATLLTNYVELQEPATRAQIAAMAAATQCPPKRMRLQALCADGDEAAARYRSEIFERRVSPLDLLERFAACELSFEQFVTMLPPLRPRYYSIASSPLADPRAVSLTVGVVAGPARSGQGEYAGVASGYLAHQPVGATVLGFVRTPSVAFRPPQEAQTPMIMVGPGTGIAPFRGFIQERAALQARGEQVGEALLFFGCRNPDHDQLYADELRGYQDNGVVDVVCAYSRIPGRPKVYVQQQIAAQAARVWDLIEQGATIYVCGDAAGMAPQVREAFAAIYRERAGADREQAERWLRALEGQGRYLADVWAS